MADMQVDYDGDFTITYTTSDGQESVFRARPEAARLFAAAPEMARLLRMCVREEKRLYINTTAFENEVHAVLATLGGTA